MTDKQAVGFRKAIAQYILAIAILTAIAFGMMAALDHVESRGQEIDDAAWIQCDTDAECEALHGHDLFGNPTFGPADEVAIRELQARLEKESAIRE